jgi:DNA-binding Lrp family transcriptional regulator
MQSEDLSIKERAVLFALMGEAREVSNSELAERAGFRLDGKERRRLNDRKLVDSRKIGRTYAHELADAGWDWCATHLSEGPQGRSSSMEGALYGLLGGLARYLEYSEQSLADVFQQRDVEEPKKPDAIAELIRAAYVRLASEPGKFVKLSELHAELSDVPRRELDSSLEGMYRAQQVNLVPQSNQQALTQADRKSALRIGGEAKHMISIRQV